MLLQKFTEKQAHLQNTLLKTYTYKIHTYRISRIVCVYVNMCVCLREREGKREGESVCDCVCVCVLVCVCECVCLCVCLCEWLCALISVNTKLNFHINSLINVFALLLS